MPKTTDKPSKQLPQTAEDYEAIFKRAKSEKTLDIMYDGACNNAHRHLTGQVKTQALINIEVALDRCQQAFDTTQLGITRKLNHAINSAPTLSKYDPAEELRKALSGQ